MLAEVGIDAVSYPTLNRRLRSYAAEGFRRKLAAACAAHARLGPASLVLHDVSTLYFETDAGDGFGEPGFSKERRLEPQITIGLLTDAGGFPLMVEAFEGNTVETTAMLPTIRAFTAAHQLADVTIVADAGTVSETNRRAIEAAGLSFILGAKIPDIPYVVQEWRRRHPDQEPPDALILTQPRPAGPSDRRRDEIVYYQYRSDRGPPHAARDRRAGQQGREGRRGEGAGQAQPVHQARGRRQVGQPHPRDQGADAGGVEGLHRQPGRQRRVRDRRLPPALQTEASVRMSKHDLAARPIYHHKRESIDALAHITSSRALARSYKRLSSSF